MIGVQKGWNTETLPPQIIQFQQQPIIRVLRLIGGISLILVLSKRINNYNDYLFYVVSFFVVISTIFYVYIAY